MIIICVKDDICNHANSPIVVFNNGQWEKDYVCNLTGKFYEDTDNKEICKNPYNTNCYHYYKKK